MSLSPATGHRSSLTEVFYRHGELRREEERPVHSYTESLTGNKTWLRVPFSVAARLLCSIKEYIVYL